MKRRLKAYLAAPVIRNYDPELTRALAEAIEAAGFEIVSRWLPEWEPALKSNPRHVFERDVRGVKSANVLVAEISAPSHGVGMEIMLAYLERKPVVCVCREGEPVSSMIRGMPGIVILRYRNVKEAKELLKSKLEGLAHTFYPEACE